VSGAFVVAYELSPALYRAIEKTALAVVDLAIHPVRCLEDLLLIVRTSDERLATSFSRRAWSKDDLSWQTRVRLAYFARRDRPQVAGEDIGLLVLQTARDSALISAGRLLRALDFKEVLEAAAARHDKLLVKPHPYEQPDPETIAWLRRLPGAEFTEENVYRLLSYECVSAVYGVSSSALHEAEAAGKRVVSFAPDASRGFPLRPEWTTMDLSSFAEVITDVIAPSVDGGSQPLRPLPAGALRLSLGEGWAADIFQTWRPALPRFPVLPVGKVSFAGSAGLAYLASGWVEAEWGGVQALKAAGEIGFGIEPGVEEVEIVLRVHVSAPASVSRRRLRIYGSGTLLFDRQFKAQPPRSHRATVRLTPGPLGQERLKLVVEDLGSPSDSDDGDRFGIGLVQMKRVR